MPRLARTVCAEVPHHITQRRNRREDVFFSDKDRAAYPNWLIEYAEKHQVEILAYSLMTNHVHLVAAPATEDGLHRVLKPLHMRYAQRVNRIKRKGIPGRVGSFRLLWTNTISGRRYATSSETS